MVKTLKSIKLHSAFPISAITLDCKDKHTTYYTLYQTLIPLFMCVSGVWGGGITADTVCNEGVVLDRNFPLHDHLPVDTLAAVIVAWSMFN